MSPRLAVVHDYFTQIGGAERVVAHWVRDLEPVSVGAIAAAPDKELLELDYSSVRTTALNRLPLARRSPEYLLPVLPAMARRIPVDADAEAVLVSTSGFAHLVRTRKPKIVYWHTPARWLYEEADYRLGLGRVGRAALTVLRPQLLSADRRSISPSDRHLCNSAVTQKRLARAYGLEAHIVHPPVGLTSSPPVPPAADIPPGFFLSVGRPRGYKGADFVARAAREAGVPLVQVGGQTAGSPLPGATVLENLTDGELAWLYREALAVVSASREDFGLTTVEGYQAGTPSVTVRSGGFLETCIEGVTGEFFAPGDVQELTGLLRRFDPARYPADAVRAHGALFRPERHLTQVVQHVEDHVRASGSGT